VLCCVAEELRVELMKTLHTAIQRLENVSYGETGRIIDSIAFGVQDAFPDLKKAACQSLISFATLVQVSSY
jgi:hypothetical protein